MSRLYSGPEDTAQLIEGLPNKPEALGPIRSSRSSAVVAHTCNPSTMMEAGRSVIITSLNYIVSSRPTQAV